MNPRTFIRVLVIAAGVAAAPANAQQLTLQMKDGNVTLDAQNVPVRQILSEWSRVGGARIVNGDKVVGPPVTLQLTNLPERRALDIILRGVSGYMLAARQPGTTGVSRFDRILILPTSIAPRNPPPAATMPTAAPPVARSPIPLPAQRFNPDEPDDQADANGAAQDPQRATPGGFLRRPVPPRMPVPPPQPGDSTQPESQQPPPKPSVPTSAGNPFGLPAGSGQPGVIAPAPEPNQDPDRR